MTLRGQVSAVILLAVILTVIARPEPPQQDAQPAEQYLSAISENRPENLPLSYDERDMRSYNPTSQEGLEAFRAEHRSLEEVKTLEYYGGAKGQHLIIHPSGQMFISRGESFEKEESIEEEDVGMEGEGIQGGGDGGGSSGSDSVTIKPPPENASIAEAKPVGLAIAGQGGVASSRPTATAVVGPGGLAVARPIATAIAGVGGSGSPPIILNPNSNSVPTSVVPATAFISPVSQNAIQPHAYLPQFYYTHLPQHIQTQQVILYPYSYVNPYGRQRKN